jgi:hypothetical protein
MRRPGIILLEKRAYKELQQIESLAAKGATQELGLQLSSLAPAQHTYLSGCINALMHF